MNIQKISILNLLDKYLIENDKYKKKEILKLLNIKLDNLENIIINTLNMEKIYDRE